MAGGRHWWIAILSAAGAVGLTSQADAAIYYWQDSDPGIWRPAPPAPQRRQRIRHQADKKTEIVEKETTKPQVPLIISISIAQQKLRIYDANGLFAEAPVSTGMPGHPTPMGVFSVIQKHRYHHSNIYSGAPMPYMQRITWSGVAMHAGVLPGYPASHGCIRMPTAFAIKMWNWTKMGARVFITPGDVTPASFSHPLLATLKVQPQPIAAEEPKEDVAARAKVDLVDKTAEGGANAKAVIVEAQVELRSTNGHDDSARPAADQTPASAAPQTRTANAGSTLPATNSSVTMSDAAPDADAAPASAEQKISEKAGGSSKAETKREAAKSEAEAAASSVEKADNSAEAKASEAAKVEAKANQPKPDEPSVDKATAGERKAEQAKITVDKSAEKPADVVKAAAAKADRAAPPKRAGQIAVFVSRKDSKLYVRQNFAPLFEVPVTISPDDRPLGTHVFTAQVDKDDANVLHWSVVSLPAPTRFADRRGEDERNLRRRKIAGAAPVEAKPSPEQDSPVQALDRLKLSADAMARIAEALSTGGSIIVSDQGIAAGETGEGTDFIVKLR